MIELWFQLVEKPIFPLLGFFVGCIMGSFLNVCAYRIPIAKSIVFPVHIVRIVGYQLIGLEIFLSSHGLFKKAGQYVVLTLFQSGTFWSS